MKITDLKDNDLQIVLRATTEYTQNNGLKPLETCVSNALDKVLGQIVLCQIYAIYGTNKTEIVDDYVNLIKRLKLR